MYNNNYINYATKKRSVEVKGDRQNNLLSNGVEWGHPYDINLFSGRTLLSVISQPITMKYPLLFPYVMSKVWFHICYVKPHFISGTIYICWELYTTFYLKKTGNKMKAVYWNAMKFSQVVEQKSHSHTK